MIALLKELMAEIRMDNEVKEYWEGFDPAQTEEEEGRVKKITGRREILKFLTNNRRTLIQLLNPQQTTKGISSKNIVFVMGQRWE